MNKQRILVLSSVPLLLFSILLYKFLDLQVLQHRKFLNKDQGEIVEVKLLEPLRGEILDRQKQVLAGNTREYKLQIIPGRIENPGRILRSVAQETGRSTSDLRNRFNRIQDRIQQLVKSKKKEGLTGKALSRYRNIQQGRTFSFLDHLSFQEIRNIKIHPDRYQGVILRKQTRRTYHNGKLYGSLLGYVQSVRGGSNEEQSEYKRLEQAGYFARNFREKVGEEVYQKLEEKGVFRNEEIGRKGVEKSFDRSLRGIPGAQIIVRDRSTGKTVNKQHVESPENGRDLHLTIRTAIQKAAKNVFDRRTGAILAMNPSNGNLLGLYSSPTFDPSLLIPPVRRKDVQDLYQSGSPRPTLHRGYEVQYPPGSIFKIPVAIAALKSGKIRPSDTYKCKGVFEYNNHEYRCWIDDYDQTHGDVNLHDALKQSCNIYFYKAALDLKFRTIKKWAQKLGFGEETGVKLPFEKPGNLPDSSREKILFSIGQGSTLSTPMQILRLISAIANGGKLIRPRITKRKNVKQVNLHLRSQTKNIIHNALIDVVHNEYGTAYRSESLRNLPFKVAGKTATAQTGGDQEPHAWFTGYAPANNPTISVVVILEHAGSGGENAAPVAGKLLNKIHSAINLRTLNQ